MATIRTKSTKLSVSLKNDEYHKLTLTASSREVPLSRVISDALNNRRLITDEDRKILIQMRQDLSRVGANLNQLSHHLNAGRLDIDTKDATEVIKSVKDTVSKIKEYL
jgi:hypothetical protein